MPNFLPRFWLVEDFEIVGEREEIVPRLLDPSFDAARTVLLEEAPGFPKPAVSTNATGMIQEYAYQGNEIEVVVESEKDCLLVHSENWFPYWHAFEGSDEIPILRANGAIRAVPLEAGRHEIVFRFRSPPFELGKWITLVALMGIGALLGASLRRPGSAS